MKYSYAQMAVVATAGLVRSIRGMLVQLNTYDGAHSNYAAYVESTTQYFEKVCTWLEDKNRKLTNEQMMYLLESIEPCIKQVTIIRSLSRRLEGHVAAITTARCVFDSWISICGID